MKASCGIICRSLFVLSKLQIEGNLQPMNKRLWILSEDECFDKRLLELAIQHVKLALEFSLRKTTLERRDKIKSEVLLIREQRDNLLNT